MATVTPRCSKRRLCSAVRAGLIQMSITSSSTFSSRNTSVFQVRLRIDVSAAPAPKPRVVTLEPIDRNGKARSNIKRLTSYTSDKKRNSPASMTSRDARSTRTLNSTSSTILYEEASSERPPSPSVASTLSASSTAPRGSIHQPSEPRSSVVSASPRVQIDVPPSRTITASVKLDRTGCLPGDIVPVRISIEHVKAVRSVNGIVVTLYRQARVDQHPNLPIGPADDIENSRYEDYYPRSRTGLGGLSLSAAGSSQVWRKDLSQTFAPLMVNPHTLRAEAKVGIRVPEDAFPSIRNAPGEMISFTYSVEVVIDIHGKLGTAGSILPKLSMVDSNMSSLGTSASVGEKQKGETLTAWGVNCIDTTQIRREKNAITCVCDLVIGTMDSGKAKLRKRSETSQTDSQNAPSSTDEDFMRRDQQTAYQNGDARTQPNESYAHWDGYGHRSYSGYDEYYDQYGYENGYDYNYNNDPYYYYEQGLPATNGHGTVAPPQIEDEDGLPEKERLRRAEARMVPSEPPLEGESSGTTASHAPSAPYLPNGGYHDTVTLNAPAASSVPSSHTLPVHADFSEASDSNGTTTTPYNAPIATAPKFSQAADDKQELERQRLEAEASAPDIAHTEAGPSSAEARPDATASAPSMTEEDEIRTFGPPTVLGENGEFIAREQLPQYER
ncbi:hypothetical protein FH972_021234 [Carpinus fangiana]|uniref:Arrestin C-terminal-like domain-containing protein n=1 Tax=Carpinus fangiana TaxID=176857 RepID=A0A5N6KPB7_9ROSI|nr:hypothetical protein FH972_021234 [Carpinus fangiana]